MKRVPIKERLVNEKTIDRYADKTAVASPKHSHVFMALLLLRFGVAAAQ